MTFSDELVNWYNQNKRDLPWRHTTDAYIIWLSEIILQQTRVEQGLPYFYRFVEKYPTVTDFAAANETEILKLWQGLGYYSRGRNMLKTAQMVQQLYAGKFPTKYSELIKLKGIGEYTASAIASFSSNEPKAVVDGNVYRVIARYLGIFEPINSTQGKKLFQEAADDFLNKKNSAIHNQAIMEFGAMLCKPRNPACGICPVRLNCYAFKHNATAVLPVKLKTVKIKERYFNYFLYTDGENILMNKRDDRDIWANMYDLPMIETSELMSVDELVSYPETVKYFGEYLEIAQASDVKKHILTHQKLFIRFITLIKQPVRISPNWVFIKVENLKSLPLSKVIFIFLDNFLN
ncbi:A/G-specific adenine glycosylase [Mucilaginibacter ximonensis]|uniref:Adenine DNA glycosylase n=1 Tax=Mucilaginibacter ximonensis TaxID=538021 RepID=A0ABW5YBN2_9SPHI